jgi:hypothetical protein
MVHKMRPGATMIVYLVLGFRDTGRVGIIVRARASFLQPLKAS